MTEATDAGEDHGVIMLVDFVGFARRNQTAEARLHESIVDCEQERRGCHCKSDRGHEKVCHLWREHTVLRCERAKHEGELAPLREGKGKEESLRRLQTRDPADCEQHGEFQDQHDGDKGGHAARLRSEELGRG